MSESLWKQLVTHFDSLHWSKICSNPLRFLWVSCFVHFWLQRRGFLIQLGDMPTILYIKIKAELVCKVRDVILCHILWLYFKKERNNDERAWKSVFHRPEWNFRLVLTYIFYLVAYLLDFGAWFRFVSFRNLFLQAFNYTNPFGQFPEVEFEWELKHTRVLPLWTMQWYSF